MDEPCPAAMADYNHVYYDNVTGASLSCFLCEEAMQLEIKCMKEMNVYTPREHGAVKEQGLTPIGTRRVFTNKGDTGCSGDEKNDADGFDGHVYDICCDPTCWGISISSLESDDGREKKEPTG